MSQATQLPEACAAILAAIERTLAIDPAFDVLDGLAAEAARLAAFRSGDLTFARPHGTWVGSFNRTDEEVVALRNRVSAESPADRVAARRHLHSQTFDGTGIAYLRAADANGNGAWHRDDRVCIFVQGNSAADAGLLVLDDPDDGQAVDPQRLHRLRLAENFLAITAPCAESHLYLSRLRGSLADVRGMLDELTEEAPPLAGRNGRSAVRASSRGEVRRGATEFETLDAAQRRHILAVLESTDWVIQGPRGAAPILGVGASTLRSRMQRLGIRRPSPHHS